MGSDSAGGDNTVSPGHDKDKQHTTLTLQLPSLFKTRWAYIKTSDIP